MKYEIIHENSWLVDGNGNKIVRIKTCKIECAVNSNEIKSGEGCPIKAKIPCNRYKEGV